MYRGKLELRNDNKFGIYNSEGSYINISEEIDKLRNDKVHIRIRDKKDDLILNEIGYLSSRKIGKGIYDVYIGEDVRNVSQEELNVIEGQMVNLTQFLFNRVGEYIKFGLEVAK